VHALESLRKWIPMRGLDKDRILHQVENTVLSVVRGSVLTAIFQTFCATLGYMIVGIPAAVTMGLLTGAATIIPVLGTALIWGPIAIYLLFFSSAWKGVFLLIWGIMVVSLADNAVRTYFIGRQAKVSIFWLFIGLLGGLRVYGVRGLLIGPLLVTVIPVLLDIFENQYLSRNPED
jgi:predicted PurR-regulated permease PerM